MDPERLKAVLEQHALWLEKKGGERADLTYANLSEANLSKANLSRANLHRANLSGADLTEVYLTKTNLNCSVIGRTTFAGCELLNTTGLDKVIHKAASASGWTYWRFHGETFQKLSFAGVVYRTGKLN